MGVYAMLGQWEQAVAELLPQTHAHQTKALAGFSFAMVHAQHCHAGRLAAELPSPARVPSRQRRWERLLANPRIVPPRCCGELARTLLPRLGGPVLLLLDETSFAHDQLRCMRISVAYHKRAIPLAWVCYRPDAPPGGMPKLLWRLIARVARSLPEGLEVTLLADRGLAWPIVLDACRYWSWHYLLRLQSKTRVKDTRGRTHAARDLARCRGRRWMGAVRIFKKAGWRQAKLVAVWLPEAQERWLLGTDLPASFRRCLSYAKRTWCEEMHRDEKSSGFRWDQSQVRQSRRAERLVLVMALAMLLCLSLGTYVLKRGLRRYLEPAGRRLLSLFQLGARGLHDALIQARELPCRVYLYPP